jgi:hypothetical protein
MSEYFDSSSKNNEQSRRKHSLVDAHYDSTIVPLFIEELSAEEIDDVIKAGYQDVINKRVKSADEVFAEFKHIQK